VSLKGDRDIYRERETHTYIYIYIYTYKQHGNCNVRKRFWTRNSSSQPLIWHCWQPPHRHCNLCLGLTAQSCLGALGAACTQLGQHVQGTVRKEPTPQGLHVGTR